MKFTLHLDSVFSLIDLKITYKGVMFTLNVNYSRFTRTSWLIHLHAARWRLLFFCVTELSWVSSWAYITDTHSFLHLKWLSDFPKLQSTRKKVTSVPFHTSQQKYTECILALYVLLVKNFLWWEILSLIL